MAKPKPIGKPSARSFREHTIYPAQPADDLSKVLAGGLAARARSRHAFERGGVGRGQSGL